MGQATVDLPDPLEKPKPAPVASADDLLAQLAGDEIDRLLAESDNGKTADPAPAPTSDAQGSVTTDPDALSSSTPAVSSEHVAAAAVTAPIAAPVADETETVSTERAELAAAELSHQMPELPDLDVKVPLFLKPLVWLNSPLDALPDEWRELVGKAAILTMVNAVAVLAYVMIFRRHH